MACRGGGRGRGRGRGYGGGGGFRMAKQVPFELFPEIQDFPDAKSVKNELTLVVWSSKLQTFWNSSPYFYEGVGSKKSSGKDSEKSSKPKPPLSHFIKMTDEYVPAELGEKKERHTRKKVRWNPDSDQRKLDFLEKIENEKKGEDEKGEKEKKEGDEEEEDDEAVESEDEEFSSDNDYYKNQDFDDDDDDFNDPDEGNDEATY